MRFKSTRGGCRGVTFEEAISRGYAPDGGLFVPEVLPKLSLEQLRQWQQLTFPDLAETILALFVGEELPASDLHDIVKSCYAGFTSPDIVPLTQVGEFLVAELFHGPTFCFKDLGQQPLVRLLARFAELRGQRRTMLVSTTGDTGPAAMRAVSDAGSKHLDIVVFYPEGQISDLQRKQMTTCATERARVAAFEGGGDDMDLPLKRLAADAAFAGSTGLCGINSYNLGRPLAQMVHYFWSYFRALEKQGLQCGAAVDFVLPCGALGNLAAGYMAKLMGLPLRRLGAGVNSNDITHRTVSEGSFMRSERMEKTLSDAINIQVPYNMERVLYYLTHEDAPLIASWYEQLASHGGFALPEPHLSRLQEVFRSRRVDDEAMCATIRQSLEAHSYLPDPHTAVALAAAKEIYEGGESGAAPVVVLATASPCKFEASITQAIGREGWASYEGSADFPPGARAVLAAREQPFGRFRSQGTLAASQVAWESEVRRMLGTKGGTSRL